MPLPTLQNLNIAQPQPASMKLQAMKMQDMQKRTGLYEQQVETSSKRQAMEEKMFKINARAKHVEMAKGFLPSVTQENYGDFVAWGRENGVPAIAYKPEDEVRAMPPEVFKAYIDSLDKKAEEGLKLTGVIKQFYDVNHRLPKNAAEIKKWKDDTAPTKPETATGTTSNYMLDDGSFVRSYDKGRTYVGEDGKSIPLPTDALKVAATISGSDIAMIKSQKQAKKELETTVPIETKKTMEEIAEGGTGPYKMMGAAVDKILGGLGADAIVGKKGIFPETQKNRQILRTVKQLGKAALMNSARGAIWEQERIDELFPNPDKFWNNPRTEAQKVEVLREVLMVEKRFNNEAIKAGTMPKEVAKLRQSNIEVDKLLSIIGKGEVAVSKEDEDLINKYLEK